MTRSPPGFVDYGLLILLAAIFGAAFMLVAIVIRDIPPITAAASREAIAAVVFYIFMIKGGQSLPAWGRVWAPIGAVAILGNALPFFLIAWGQEVVLVGTAAILTSTTPIIAVIIGMFLVERAEITARSIFAVLLGFAGVVILLGVESLSQLGSDLFRQLAILLGALSYACNAFIVARLTGYPRRAVLTAVLGLSFLITLPFSLIIEQPWTLTPSTNSLMALALLAILSTAIGNLLRFEIADRQGALFLTQLSYLLPGFGVFWAWLILGEIPSEKIWISMALIVAGIWLSRTNKKQTELSLKQS